MADESVRSGTSGGDGARPTAAASDDEFFVGYLGTVPPQLARFVRRVVIVLMALLAIGGALLVSGQGPFRASRFEYGEVHAWSGILREFPQPMLELGRPGAVDSAVGTARDAETAGGARPSVLPVSRYLLVAPGKHGAQSLCAGLDGLMVVVRGTLIYRGDQVMLEIAGAPTVAPGQDVAGAPSSGTPAVALGDVDLVGQIVDSKCYLGVMNPADTVSHRACAERCLSGGIPALLRVRGADGTELCPLLTGRDGRLLNRELLDRVAVPVSVRGALERQGDLLLLRTEPQDVVRLGAE